MKICMIVEGAYPYVTGGVSSWVHQAIAEMSEHEFIVVTLGASRKEKREMKYKIPDNVIAMYEFFLQDDGYVMGSSKTKLKKKEFVAFESLFFGDGADWKTVMEYFKTHQTSLDSMLMGKDFLKMVISCYQANFRRVVFSDFLWTMRSIYLPLYSILTSKVPEADLYHCLSTGYAGVLGCMCKYLYQKPLLISEHGIYTREREEEIIKADWVKGIYKDLWINQFKKFSDFSYEQADSVTALYTGNRDLQIEFGCSPEKIRIIPNGIETKDFAEIPGKDPEDSYINIGAILRVAPIKDVKTMISAFAVAKKQNNRLKLWIMGPLDEQPEYVRECEEMVSYMDINDVIFTGQINVKEYIGKMDILVLSSLSEGQPLVILEGYAAKKPFITTNVGDCKGLVHGNQDGLGNAGIVVPVMNIVKMSEAMLLLAEKDEMRLKMGEVGFQRALLYGKKECFSSYRALYNELAAK